MNRTSVQCRGCTKLIVWMRTRKGKRIPVDAETVAAHEMIFDHKKHVSHFATCPKAAEFRKRGDT